MCRRCAGVLITVACPNQLSPWTSNSHGQMLSHRCCIVVTASKFRSFEVLKFPPKSNLVALSNDSLDSARMGKSVNSIYCTTAIVVVSFVCWPLPFANTRHDVTTSKSNKSNVDSITNHDDDAPATGDRRLSIASTNDACTQYGIQCIFFVCWLTWFACLLVCLCVCCKLGVANWLWI